MDKELLNLRLPKSWNNMTVREMEILAGCMMRESARVSPAHQYNNQTARTEAFFRYTGLKVIDVMDDGYLVTHKEISRPFKFFTADLYYWLTENMKWMDETPTRTIFPYPEYRSFFRKFHGPAVLMDGTTWNQYRVACDCMDMYSEQSNYLIKLAQSRSTTEKALHKQKKMVEMAKSMFLSTIFCSRVWAVDKRTGIVKHDYMYVASQTERNRKYFTRFPDEKFQVVLFWWMGIMNYLQRTYPKVFKADKKKRKEVNPLQLYTQTITTMEKYLGLKEEDVNDETYTNVLKHINDLVEQNEEFEKINKK